MNKKWSIIISVIIVIVMGTIIFLLNKEIKEETGGLPGYEDLNMESLPKDVVDRLPEDWQTTTDTDKPGLAKGDLAPDFELTTLSGDTVKLSDYRGKTVMLNFWASWCPPCRSEMPHMENYYTDNKESDDMEILAVNMTKTEKNKVESAKEFVDEYNLTFPILLDKDSEVMKMYQIKVYPTSYIINKDGVITDKVMLPLDDTMIKQLIEESNAE
ncbi:peroxiredoxin [Sporosarcina sp. P19]|uniref:peroxiredoxin family protein n=1 Tax=Sporosarcina sp. P19 TaxID=2048258 RepID=UPI001E4FA3A4|nr:TlpA disulfide reductase family protein [Sporosarcina sp. P19]